MDQEREKNRQKLLNYAYFFLKFRIRTEKEIVIYLTKKAKKLQIDEQLFEQVCQELKEQDLINDQKFVQLFVDSKIRQKGRSEKYFNFELAKKGIDQSLIDQYFSDSPLDQLSAAVTNLEKKWSAYSRLEPQKRKQKAIEYLSRQGFPYAIIKKTIEQIEEKE